MAAAVRYLSKKFTEVLLIPFLLYVGTYTFAESGVDKPIEFIAVIKCAVDGLTLKEGLPVKPPAHHTYSIRLIDQQIAERACKADPNRELHVRARVIESTVTQYPKEGWGERSGKWNTEYAVQLLEVLGSE